MVGFFLEDLVLDILAVLFCTLEILNFIFASYLYVALYPDWYFIINNTGYTEIGKATLKNRIYSPVGTNIQNILTCQKGKKYFYHFWRATLG